MNTTRLNATLIALWLGCAAPAAYAQALSRADTSFLKAADQAGRTEIEAGGMAMERAVRDEVKRFAQQMTTDHARTGDELKTLAASKGVALPGEPSLNQRAKMKMLTVLKGGSFDRQYASVIGVDAHEETVKLFRRAAATAQDAEVKAFASRTLPALEHHLSMALDLRQSVARPTP